MMYAGQILNYLFNLQSFVFRTTKWICGPSLRSPKNFNDRFWYKDVSVSYPLMLLTFDPLPPWFSSILTEVKQWPVHVAFLHWMAPRLWYFFFPPSLTSSCFCTCSCVTPPAGEGLSLCVSVGWSSPQAMWRKSFWSFPRSVFGIKQNYWLIVLLLLKSFYRLWFYRAK